MGKLLPATIPVPLVGTGHDSRETLRMRSAWLSRRLRAIGRQTPLRVLVASNSLACGGSEHQILRLLPHLGALGLEVEHLYYSAPHHLRASFEEQQLRSHFLDRDRLGQVRFWSQAVSQLRRGRFDVVHAFNGTANVYVLGAALLAGVPVLLAGWRNRPMGGGLKFLLPLSLMNRFVSGWVINAASNTEALEQLWGAAGVPTYVVPNVLDFTDRDYTEAEPLPEDVKGWVAGRLIVGTVGTISRQKNFDLFLDVAKALAEHSSRLCFCLVGGAEARSQSLVDHLQRRIERENLSAWVRMLGPSENVAGVLPNFSIFTCTSDFEGCPNVVIEALRARLPVVMTDCCDTSLLIRENSSGHVVPVGAAGAMAHQVGRLAADPRLRRQFGALGRELAEKHFSAAENAWLMASIYLHEWQRALLNGRGRAAVPAFS